MKTIILFAVITIISCNTPKHMAKAYPLGYWMKGKYLSKHNYPKSKADSIAWLNK